MPASLCRKKSVKKPNRCKKVRGCKVASGPKRTFCRKAKNTRRKGVAPKAPKTRRNRK